MELGDPGRLAAVHGYQLLGGGSVTAFDELVELAAVACEVPMALVSLVDEDTLWIKARVGTELDSFPVEGTLCRDVVVGGQPLVVPDAAADERFAELDMVAGSAGIRFYAGMPLIAPSGYVVGTLSVLDVRPWVLGDTARGILERLSRRVVEAMELRQRTRDLELERQLLQSTGEVLGMITAGAGLPEVLTTVARAVEQQDPEVLCSILLSEGDVLRDGAGPSLPGSYRSAIDGVRIGPSVGSCGMAALSHRRVVSSDIRTDPHWEGHRELAASAGLRACWSAPILDTDGTVLGTFATYFRSPREPEDRHWQLIQRWVDLTGLAITRTRAQGQIRRMALTDPLTGLPNRAGLHVAYMSAMDQLVAEQPTDRRIAVLLMDLDRFKMVNDSLGHAVGDEYLSEIAERVSLAAGSRAVVSRFGGDEFVVLTFVGGAGDREAQGGVAGSGVEELGARLVEAVRRPVSVHGRDIVLSASIGVAVADPVEVGVTTVLRNADAALYRAKGSGRDRVVIFDAAMHEQAVRVLELEADLREAIVHEQLSLAFQPNVDLADGRVIGVEALVRWNHPVRGPIPPLQFVPVAEESGLIHPLGRWVLRTALAALAGRRHEPQWAEVTLWVNVSAPELGPELVGTVARALSDSGVPAERLGLEVTESSLMADLPTARSVLLELRSLGVRLAVDDFGTGYSSLSQLKHLPVDVLKIDRSFIDGLGLDRVDDGVVEAILALAKAHRLVVVAEGVERPEQRDRLRSLGCDRGQGYLFGRPGSLAAVRPSSDG